MNSDRYEKYMNLAIKEAKKAFMENEVPVGCVIVKDDVVISRGYNQVMGKKSAVYHAEIVAIKKAGKKLGDFRLEECEMYVTLEPCAMCAGAIINSRIKRVIIGARDVKRGFCGSVDNLLDKRELNHKSEVVFGVLEERCLSIIQDFFKNLRKNNKSD